jgi:hypothetical protein
VPAIKAMIMLRSNSHRATNKLLKLSPDSTAYYSIEKLFQDNSKGYYLVNDDILADALKIKGISKPKSQNIADYGKCWP